MTEKEGKKEEEMEKEDLHTFITAKFVPESKFNQYLPMEKEFHFGRVTQKQQEMIKILTNYEEYKEIRNLREQVGFFFYQSKKYAAEKKDKEYKLSQEDIGHILDLSTSQVKNHCRKYKLYIANQIKDNGRPFSLSKEQIKLFGHWLDSWIIPPRVIEAKTYIYNQFKINMHHSSFLTLLDKLGYKITKVQPMEEKRYTVDYDKIQYHYQELEVFTGLNMIPSAFFINFDEEGHEPFEDSKSEKVVSPKQGTTPSYYPIPRKGNRSTFLGCITGDGKYVKPLIITKRKTFDEKLLDSGITPEHLMLAYNASGYITTEIFNQWIDHAFAPFISARREQLKYDGVGVVLCDGFGAHISEHFFEVCYSLNMQVFFLPAHSSHITQPLDLGIFAVHKQYSKLPSKIDDIDEDAMTELVIRIFTGWQKAATTANIVSAWKQVGACYVRGTVSYNAIVFYIVANRVLFPMKDEPLNTKLKDKLTSGSLFYNTSFNASKKELTDKRTRFPVESFNSSEFQQKISQIKRAQLEYKSPTIFQKLYLAILPLEQCEKKFKDKLDVNMKGRPKKTVEDAYTSLSKIQSRDAYKSLSFDEKVELELQSLGLSKIDKET